MNEENKIYISNEKIIDLVMHGATRVDIERLDKKIDDNFTKLDSKIDRIIHLMITLSFSAFIAGVAATAYVVYKLPH